MSLLHTLFVPAFIQQFALMDYPEWSRLALQFSIFLASAVLTYYMFQFKNRTPLDTSVLLREFALTLLFARFIYLNLIGDSPDYVVVFTYAFVAVTCIMVVVNVIRAKRSFITLGEEENGTEEI